jgi:hypothetical protein
MIAIDLIVIVILKTNFTLSKDHLCKKKIVQSSNREVHLYF